MKQYVIIGGGPAGATAAETLRKLDDKGEITVVSDEAYPFYKREHIAGLISNDRTEEELFVKGRDFYQKIGVNLVKGRVLKVSVKENRVLLDKGSAITYDSLLIASGGKPIVPPWPGIQLEGILTLYTLDDAKKVTKLAKEAKSVVIIGGGTIAMKAIPLLRKIGLKVSLVEKMDRLWSRMFDKRASEIVENKLKENGTKILLSEEVVEFKGKGAKVKAVVLKSQQTIPCDLVIVTIGIRPSINFLRDSMIKLDRGVLVDQHLKTNVPNVYAAGDVAQVPDPLFRTPTLHPNWSYAEEQGEIAVYNMAGFGNEYEGAVPLFSMDVYDLGIVVAGITQPQGNFEELSKLSLHESLYRKFVLQDNKLIGALIIGKGLKRKLLKSLVKKAVLKMVKTDDRKIDLLREDFDFASILSKL